MNDNRRIFDYSLPAKREPLGELVDNLPIRDEKKVADFIRKLNVEKAEEKKQSYISWLNNAVVPVWDEYAREIHAVLKVQQEENELYISVVHPTQMDLCRLGAKLKAVLFLADYACVTVGASGLQLDLVYSAKRDAVKTN